MDRYIDINILPDPEFSSGILMNALYSKLHRVLVELQASDVAVSFPEYRRKGLGSVLRLHGSASRLEQLMRIPWLKGMVDLLDCSVIKPVPAESRPSVFKRRQYKTSVERLRRRRMKRKGESYEMASQAIPYEVEQTPSLPYINLRSRSTGQQFSVFIERKFLNEAVSGEFNTYGLSLGGTIPWF